MKTIIRLFAIAAIVLFSNNASATHLAGGDIQYEYISSSGNSHTYKIKMRLYRDAGGISMPSSVTVYGCSAAFSNVSTTLSQVGTGGVAPTLFDCVTQGSAGTVTIELYLYEGTIILPGNAPDWTFSWSSCCRNFAIDNITNPGSAGFYIESKLNNTIGQNTSPFFVSEPVRAFCVGKQFNWKQSAVEPDGDSLFYRLEYVREGQSSSCSGTNLTYAAGYSYTQPISTTPVNSMTMNPVTGIISFVPSTVEVDVMAVTVDEYRYDSTQYVYLKIGSSNRDMQITVSQNCSPTAQQGVQLDYTVPGMYPDPVNGLPTVDYTCLDTAVTLHFATPLDCSSIAPDGTDFRLTTPTGQPLAVKAIIGYCDWNGDADSVSVVLHKPLSVNGKYFLYSKQGNDGNTLLNKCGFPMNEFDTIQLNVTGCYEPDYDIENVTIDDDMHPIIEWSADTNSYPTYLFDEWQIYRKDPGGAQFNKIGTVVNQHKGWFKDVQVNAAMVDADKYEYRIRLQINDHIHAQTRAIKSILLENADAPGMPFATPDSINLIWNTYNGWSPNEYTVVLQEQDASNNWTLEQVHSHLSSPANPTTDTTYLMMNTLAPGLYRVCVRTTNPVDTQYTAYSNCLPIIIPEPPFPDTVEVPNFITPNGDGVNDGFIIKNIADWDEMSTVRIYNRWGKLVWESDLKYDNNDPWKGTNQNGARLADGVYFYTIELFDLESGMALKVSGSVHILGGTR